jgi:hypothetical protein
MSYLESTIDHDAEHAEYENDLNSGYAVPPDITDEKDLNVQEWLCMRNQRLNELLCKFRGHVVNEGIYTDSHGNEDSLSYCERCGEYDV